MNRQSLMVLLVAVVVGVTYLDSWPARTAVDPSEHAIRSQSPKAQAAGQVEAAFAVQQSDVQVRGEGRVVKLLADDLDGSRHQRFLLKTDAGHSLLIVHNIDLAPRLDTLAVGDRVEFYGEYEWNNKGGLVHWTHRDPRDRHAHGYLRHQGRICQ